MDTASRNPFSCCICCAYFLHPNVATEVLRIGDMNIFLGYVFIGDNLGLKRRSAHKIKLRHGWVDTCGF
jgi:hypothetical protein